MPAPKRHFTVGIVDDVTGLSLTVDETFEVEPADIGPRGLLRPGRRRHGRREQELDQDHRRGDRQLGAGLLRVRLEEVRRGDDLASAVRAAADRAPYLIVAARRSSRCHQYSFLERYDVLASARAGRRVPAQRAARTRRGLGRAAVRGPGADRRQAAALLRDRRLRGGARPPAWARASTRSCRPASSRSPACCRASEAIAQIKHAIEKTYKKRGDAVVQRNFDAVDATLAHLHEVAVPASPTASRHVPPPVPDGAPDFVKRVTAVMLANQGDRLPVSAFPIDGTWPTGTSKWEKRNIATEIPGVGRGALHPVQQVRARLPARGDSREGLRPGALAGRAGDVQARAVTRSRTCPAHYTVQVAPEDCTGCALCVMVCPAKDKTQSGAPGASTWRRKRRCATAERENYAFFLELPEVDRTQVKPDVKSTQFLQPLFEYSGACAGCGETPYIKLMTQLFGDRLVVANATGCSSIYGGNLPTTPYTTNATAADRRGRIRSSRTTRSSATGCGCRSISTTRAPARCSPSWRRTCRRTGRRDPDGGSKDRSRHRRRNVNGSRSSSG